MTANTRDWLMSDDPAAKKAREFFGNLSASIRAAWQVAREQNPTLTDDELRPIVAEMHVRMHAPALFRVGVNFEEEHKKAIQRAADNGDTPTAQRLILDGLNEEFADDQ